jgi:lysine-N-methylase
MQIDSKRASDYLQDPGLSDSIINKDNQYMMKHDTNNFCVKLESGRCAIHDKYGENFLGDACYFYPRIVRKLGDQNIMSATLSCPEITRILLENESDYELEDVSVSRIPIVCKDYLPTELTEDDALLIHDHFIGHVLQNKDKDSASLLSELITVSKSLDTISKISWIDAAPFLLETAATRIIPVKIETNDPFNIINALMLVIHASKLNNNILNEVLATIASSLALTIDQENLTIQYGPNSIKLHQQLINDSEGEVALRKYLYAQIASNLFPFAGLGTSLYNKSMVMSLKFVTIRLALACHKISDEVKVIHSISRLYDHLQSDELLISICNDFHWMSESRLLGLVMGK